MPTESTKTTQETRGLKLSSCPFCGSCAEIRQDNSEPLDDQWWYVDCCNCPVQTYPQATKAEAARVWNTRVPPNTEQVIRLREAAQRLVDAYEGEKASRLGNGQARRSLDEFRAALQPKAETEGEQEK